MDNETEKLDPEILDRIDAEENNPYRHIEEASEENYKAVDNK